MEISEEQRREAILHEKSPELSQIVSTGLYEGKDVHIAGFGSAIEPGDIFLVATPSGVEKLTCSENLTPESCLVLADTPRYAAFNSWECFKIDYLIPHPWREPADRNSYAWHRALCADCGRGSDRGVHKLS